MFSLFDLVDEYPEYFETKQLPEKKEPSFSFKPQEPEHVNKLFSIPVKQSEQKEVDPITYKLGQSKEQQISEIDKTIADLEQYVKELREQKKVLLTENPLDDFKKMITKRDQIYEIDESSLFETFNLIYNTLYNNERVDISLIKIPGGFDLLVQNKNSKQFTDDDKLQIKRLKYLFNKLNM